MNQLTRDLGAFVARTKLSDIPKEAFVTIHFGLTDCVGTTLAGRNEPPAQILKQVLDPVAGNATLLFEKSSARAPEAAWINGSAAHALDFDDVGLRGHPSTVIVPAILAEAEELGSSGADIALAYAVGYEVWADLASRDPDQHHNKGWHPTGIFGAIGAAAACAKLHGLNSEQSAMAIALGASQSAGIMANFGTMTKPFHAGRSSHAGLMAARLAGAGFTSSLDALEHTQGFLAAVSPKGNVDLTTPTKIGQEWALVSLGLSIKKYPLCFCAHRALDGMLDLLARHPFKHDQIESITVTTSRRNSRVLRNNRPKTGLQAKFSMEFAMASCVVGGRAGLNELTDSFVMRPEVQGLIEKVTVMPEDKEDPVKLGYAMHDLVEVVLKDGNKISSGPITQVRGDATNPLKPEELWVKFEDCATAGNVTEFNIRAQFDALMSIEHVGHVRDIPGMMR